MAGHDGGGRGKLIAALAAAAAALGGIVFFWRRKNEDGGPWRRKPAPEEESLVAGHELKDMRTGQVVRWLALLTVAVTALVVGITIFEIRMIGHAGPLVPVVAEPPRVTPPPQPRLETVNGETLEQARARWAQEQSSYTWVDQGAGVVALPIDRAIELTIQRGLPVRTPQGGNAGGAPGLTLPQGSSSGRTLETIP